MTIEEAIEHCKEQAAKLRTTGDCGCVECAAEHEQLAEWLAELKQRREVEATKPPKTEEEGMNRYIDADKYEQELRQMIEIVRETGRVPGINGELVLVKPLCTAYIKGVKAAITALTTCREHEEVKQPKTKADKIRQMTDEELAELIVRYSIQGAIQAHGIVDIERIKSMEEDVINSACGKKDIETALNILKQDVNEDAEN